MLNSKGFTLIEFIAVLTILGILVAVGVHQFMKVDNSAASVVLRDAVAKFNDAEKHHWTNFKLSGNTYENDDQIFDLVKTDLVKILNWKSISPTGGVVGIRDHYFTVVRKPSTQYGYAVWEVSDG